jgi:cysteine desulfurase
MRPVYMDHHATTPVDPAVAAAMLPFLQEEFGNPASVTHVYGRRAADAVEGARASIAAHLGVSPEDVLFTSGATESNNLALRGTAAAARERRGAAHVITSAVEHKSVLDTAADLARDGVRVSVVTVDGDGLVEPDDVRQALRPDTCLVSIQTANSEVGTLQPIAAIAAVCAEAGVPLHTDAAQAVGRVPVPAERVALLSLSGHKMYGPKGIGALICGRRVRLRPMQTGGGHERNRRSGTLNVPAIIGLARALAIAMADREAEAERLRELRDRLWSGIQARIPDARLHGHPSRRLPNNLNVSFRHVQGESLLMAVKGFALSSGSACTSGASEGSYVIRALGAGDEAAHGSIRFGLGRGNNAAQVDALVEELAAAVARLRAISAAAEEAPRAGGEHVRA